MKILKSKKLMQVLTSLLAAVLVTLIIGIAGAANRLDNWVVDSWYQSPKALDGEIIVIGIDEKTIAEIGPYNTWDRTVMASALEVLGQDPENKPAVVAIDTVYASESSPEADDRLVAAAEKLGNVITGAFATFSTMAVFEEGSVHFDKYAIKGFDEPFEKLKDVTVEGHINAMYDDDGILRHAILYVEPDGKKVYSMAYEAAKIYAEENGIEITPPKTSKRGHFYVDYSALPDGYNDGYSLTDLINGRMPADTYAGKIVFIGPYTAGLQDAYFTPIERSKQMYGVEYQANVTQAYLDGNYKTEVGKWPQVLILFIVTFLAMFLFQKTGIRVSSAIAAGLIIIGAGVGYIAYNVNIGGTGHVLHPLWIPIGVLVLYVVSIVIHYVKSAIEKQRVSRTFERYVAPEIVKEILKEGTESLSLGGKVCDIAVLFVDVRGFTTMSEALDPETVVEIINKYLTLTTDCIMRNHGTLDKFVGDCTMAFWNAPFKQDDPVYYACRAAMDMVEGSKALGEELQAKYGRSVSFGIGVNWGKAVVGNIGAPKRMDYTAIGDTVNTAARLEANAPGSTVYISRAVADALGDRITCTSLGSTIKLKGKADGFEILTLDSMK